jgi:phosphatidylglycerol:prolipoprotein diacylglycerol transferase
MFPILLHIGDVTLYTYGTLVALACVSGVGLARHEARRRGEDPARVTHAAALILIGAVVGTRLLYVLLNPQRFDRQPLEVLKFWKGGLVFYGAFGGALITALLLLHWWRLPVRRYLDIFTPAVAWGQFLGRLGCFSAGCCYGRAGEPPWAVTFTHPQSLAPPGVALHPVQLYEAGANLMIFLWLWRLRRRPQQDGTLFGRYVLAYAAVRFAVEFFRGDPRGLTLPGPLSVSQWIAITLFMLSGAGLWWHRRCGRRASEAR